MLSIVMAVGVSLSVLGFVEMFLRRQERAIRQSDQLEPGLLQHDKLLGWALVPDARGTHTHHDFSTEYRIGTNGFRFDPAVSGENHSEIEAILGDSFTFGLGVKDSETFISQLNRQSGAQRRFINCAVPGYSTDQEILIAQRDVMKLKPRRLWLAVCLVNDLIDILHPYPMQANRQKPFFQLSGRELALQNIPVPLEALDPSSRRLDLLGEIMGPTFRQRNWSASIESRSIIARILADNLLPPPDISTLLAERNRRPLELFTALVTSLAERVKLQGVSVGLICIPGRSRIENPGSIAAQYQKFVEEQLAALAKDQSLPLIPLTDALLEPSLRADGSLYFPHDGHFTPKGHAVVARTLASRMPALLPGQR